MAAWPRRGDALRGAHTSSLLQHCRYSWCERDKLTHIQPENAVLESHNRETVRVFGSEYGPDSGACTVRGFHTTVPLNLGPVRSRVRAVSCVCAADPDKRWACSGTFQAFHNSPRFILRAAFVGYRIISA